jgi:ubiquinone/menaquinone biosynthesis C-methylase UbiE
MQDLAAEKAFYDELFSRNPENEHITAGYDEIHDLAFPSVPSGRVLDLGCGTGAHAIRLARRGCRVVAMDLSAAGVKGARERFRREGKEGLFVVGDAERLPFRSGEMEIIWTSLLLHHFPRLDVLPDELARVARRGVIALETNGGNLLSWFAFNVVNRLFGLSTTTCNQRALFPGKLHRRMARSGLTPSLMRYIHRAWQDDKGLFGLVRKVYDGVARFLPERFRANKFLVTYTRSGS